MFFLDKCSERTHLQLATHTTAAMADRSMLLTEQEVLGRTNSLTFPHISHLFEVLEPNLMEIN
jgi:hypothetical protein